MRVLTIGVLTAAGLAMAAPAFADNVSVGVGGVGVGVHSDRDRVVDRDYRREHVTVGMGERRHCKVVIIHRDGMTKKIKRCG